MNSLLFNVWICNSLSRGTFADIFQEKIVSTGMECLETISSLKRHGQSSHICKDIKNVF